MADVSTVLTGLDLLLGNGSARSGRFAVFRLVGESRGEEAAGAECVGSLLVCREGAGGDAAAEDGDERRTHAGQ